MTPPRQKSIENGKLQVLSPSLLNAFDSSAAFGCERRGWFKYVKGLPEPTTDAMTRGTHLHAMNEEYLKTGKLLLGTPEQTAWFNAGRHFLDEVRDRALAVFKDNPTMRASVPLLIEWPLPAGFAVYGVPVSPMSKCDVVTVNGIIDWKTTSDIEKYGKTPGQLAKDVQMLIYAKAFHPVAEVVTLTHGQYQTKGRVKFHASSVELTRNELDTNYEGVIFPLVEKVKAVAAVTDVNEVTPNRNACRTCPHSAVCPTEKASLIMSIFDRLKKSQTQAAAVSAPAEKTTLVTANGTVLPPDAPPSKPELAAKPVEGFEAVPPPRRNLIVEVPAPAKYTSADLQLLQKGDDPLPDNMDVDGLPFRRNGTRVYPPTSEPSPSADLAASRAVVEDQLKELGVPEKNIKAVVESAMRDEQPVAVDLSKTKRGPGRPPGAKNKSKLVTLTAPAGVDLRGVPEAMVAGSKIEYVETITKAQAEATQFESVTVNYGLTLNLGNFNSVRFDVTMGAKGSNPDATYEAVMARVRAKVTEEIEKIQAEQKAAQTLNPNGGSK